MIVAPISELVEPDGTFTSFDPSQLLPQDRLFRENPERIVNSPDAVALSNHLRQVRATISDQLIHNQTCFPEFHAISTSTYFPNSICQVIVHLPFTCHSPVSTCSSLSNLSGTFQLYQSRVFGWKMYYYILDWTNQIIMYYSDNQYRDPVGDIMFDRISALHPSTQVNRKKHPSALDLVTLDHTYTLIVQDPKKFIQTICSCVGVKYDNSSCLLFSSNTIQVVAALDDTIQDLLDVVLERCSAWCPSNNQTFGLKATGAREYFLDSMSKIKHYQLTRLHLDDKSRLKLSLVDLTNFARYQPFPVPPPIQVLFSPTSLSLSSISCVASSATTPVPTRSSSIVFLSSINVHVDFKFTIQWIQGLPPEIFQPHDEEELQLHLYLYLQHEFYLVQRIPLPSFAPTSRIQIQESYSLLTIDKLPLETRLLFVLARGADVLLTAGIRMYDIHHRLVQKQVQVNFYQPTSPFNIGPLPMTCCPEMPSIQVEFPSFTSPVVHHSLSGSMRSSRGSFSLGKEGVLMKKGPNPSLSKWKSRHFRLDHRNHQLHYFQDAATDQLKGSIDLLYAHVQPADEYNHEVPWFSSKTTAKIYQTWCFVILPENSGREYYLGASTPQERLEWMNILKEAAVPSLLSDPKPLTEDLLEAIERDPFFQLNAYEVWCLWHIQSSLLDHPKALARFLQLVNWADALESQEAVELLNRWKVSSPEMWVIQFLDQEYPHTPVRHFALTHLREIGTWTFRLLLPQFVQALKFETHHTSELALLLLTRAIEHPAELGFDLFWHLYVEWEIQKDESTRYQERYGVMLQLYYEVCGEYQQHLLKLQYRLFSQVGEFAKICNILRRHQAEGPEKMQAILTEELAKVNDMLPDGGFPLPLDPRMEVGKLIIAKCRVIHSSKLPLYLVFENGEPNCDEVAIIFKIGDDLRQDTLTLQLIRIMDAIWRDYGMNLCMEPYRVISTSRRTGLIQVVTKAITISTLQKRYGGIYSPVYKHDSITLWLEDNHYTDTQRDEAIDLYKRSCAGYCVATYLLRIGDRHNDNMMICSSGRFFHIDFGHILGNCKYQYGFKRERSAVVLTKQMIHPFTKGAGSSSTAYDEFMQLACDAYNCIRKHDSFIIALLKLMLPANLPELLSLNDLNCVVATLRPGTTDEAAAASLREEFQHGLKDRYKGVDDVLHNIKHA